MSLAVVDASLALKMVFDEGDALAARSMASPYKLLAPEFIDFEVANALWSYVRWKGLDRGSADRAFQAFRQLPIELQPIAPLLETARKIGFQLDTPIYDCAYWALAIERDADFLTADSKFAAKLRAAKIAGTRLKLLR